MLDYIFIFFFISLSAIRVVSPAYLRLWIFLAGIKTIRTGWWRADVFNLICHQLIIRLLLDLSFMTSKIRYSLNEIVLNMNEGFCCFCYCYCSVTKSCLTLCDPTNNITPGSSILHHLLEFAQMHVH